MRWLVTLAPDAEPYASGARALADVARAAGWGFCSLGDAALRGEAPWQAKRHVVRWAFEQGADRVAWCDSDVVVKDPILFAKLLNGESRTGLWSPGRLSVESQFRGMEHGIGGMPDYSVRARELYRDMCRRFGFGEEAGHFHDWLVVYDLAPAKGLHVCDLWDTVAVALRAKELTWADGMTLAIAARLLGLQVHFPFRNRVMARAVVHLLHSFRNQLYAEKAGCSL